MAKKWGKKKTRSESFPGLIIDGNTGMATDEADFARLEALAALPADVSQVDLSKANLVVIPEDLLRLTSLTV
jgi:hypothetical protein